MKTLMDIMKSSMTSLYESILDIENDISDSAETMINAWFEENFDGDYVLQIKGKDVRVFGWLEAKHTFKKFTNAFNFRYIDGNMWLDNSEIESLENGPEEIGGALYCNNCEKLISLKGCPKIINNDFSIRKCKKLKLDYFPKIIHGMFDCAFCPKISLNDKKTKKLIDIASPSEVYVH